MREGAIAPSGRIARELFAPLKDTTREDIVYWGGACVLPALLMYPGSAAWYPRWFAVSSNLDELRWNSFLFHHFAAAMLFAAVPMALQKFVLKRPLREIGFTWGDWRAGLVLTTFGLLVLPFACSMTRTDPEFLREYPLSRLAVSSPRHFFLWTLGLVPYFFAWEFFFRGFLGMGLQRRVGVIAAMFAQTAISVIIHIGKPFGETLSAIPGGILLGLVALRTRSIVWPFLCHLWVGVLVHIFCGYYGAP